MNLSDFAKPLISKDHFIKASFGGFQGSGKTRTAFEFITGTYKQMKLSKPILILDNEKGSRFLINLFKKNKIEAIAKETTSLKDVQESFNFLQKKEIDFLFIDSLTKIYYRYIKDYRLRNNKNFMTLQDWGKILPLWNEEFSEKFVQSEGNIVFTGRGGFEYEKEEDEKDENGVVTQKGQFVKSGFKMKIAGETPYETDLNVWMNSNDIYNKEGKPTKEIFGYVLKDRSDSINGKVLSFPTFKDFKPVINFIQNLPTGIVAEETEKNLIPTDKDYFERELRRKIEIEKIEGVFELNNLGTPRANEDKKVKTAIIQKIFGTTSKTEIEKMLPNELNFRRQELEELFKELKDVEPLETLIHIENYNLSNEVFS
ncbi:MAG: AAA family ATPase [Ignavibacteriae bacterium]|nr:AAA family ATPase [Ignavibacteriota bacterium]